MDLLSSAICQTSTNQMLHLVVMGVMGDVLLLRRTNGCFAENVLPEIQRQPPMVKNVLGVHVRKSTDVF
jgi:hypothetical protein